MNIHEYQAKEVLRGFGVTTGRGIAAFTVDEAVKAAETLGGPVWVVKSQIHAGGRGKGGGVKVVKSVEDVKAEATRMLGMTLVTHQTGPEGKLVQRLYIEEGTAIARELYLSIVVDRETSRVAFIASTEGGMNIEEVAHATPEKIITVQVDPASGLRPLCRPPHRRSTEARGRPRQAMREDDRPALQGLHREGHEPARDQPARRHQ
jgi:succinyl-CoA synthetase beta subunit